MVSQSVFSAQLPKFTTNGNLIAYHAEIIRRINILYFLISILLILDNGSLGDARGTLTLLNHAMVLPVRAEAGRQISQKKTRGSMVSHGLSVRIL